jgi:O-antigen ligase
VTRPEPPALLAHEQGRPLWREVATAASGTAVAAPLGPLATWLGQTCVVGALVFSFGVLFDVLPPGTALLLLAPATGCVLLAPKALVRGARVSLPLLALLAWTGLSWGWSVNPGETVLRLWTVLLPVLALMAVAAVLRLQDLATAVRWSVRTTLLLVVLALVARPAARVSGSSDFIVEGWRGTFPDKNSMALYLVFALVATLALDRGSTRATTLGTIAVLLVGSQSATGLSAAVFASLLWAWLGLLRRGPVRQSAFLVLSSFGAALLLAAVVVTNLTAILEIYGKDADLTGRTDIWAAVAQSVTERPITGYGLGALLSSTAPSSETFELWRQIGFEAVHAHNGALDLLGQLGAVGLVLYVAVVWVTARTAVQRLRTAPRAAAFALVMLSAQLLMSVSENVYLGPWLLVLVLIQAPLLRPVAHSAWDGAGGG